MGVTRLRSTISVSLGLHVLFALLCALLISQRAAHLPPSITRWIEVEALPPSQLKSRENRETRVVQTTKAQKSEQAAPDAFLGEQTQTVDRQTVSRTQTVQSGSAKMAKPSQEQAKSQSQKESRTAAVPVPSLGSLAAPILPKFSARTEQQQLANDRVADEFGAAGAPSDYIQGMKESDHTALNTREFQFFGYFQRIRQRLDLAWGSVLKEHLIKFYRSGRRLASEMDHTTRVLVTMDQQGEITQVQVIQDSGTFELDDAAVKAFNRAGPFPNPPKGIVDASGKIQIRWDFVLKT